MNKTINDIAALLLDLATKHKQIGAEAFARTYDEWAAKMKSIDGYGMLMEPIRSKFTGSEAQLYEPFIAGFTICYPWQTGDFDGQWTALANCQQICKQVLARIRYYSTSYNKNTPDVWHNFDLLSVVFEPVYFEFDQRVGYSCTFELMESVDLRFDITDTEDVWEDLP